MTLRSLFARLSLKRLFYIALAGAPVLAVTAGFVLWQANLIIQQATDDLVYESVEDIPFNKVGLLLGTIHRLHSGAENPYFRHRITATLELFRAGKIEYILISGDNGHHHYNEPLEMKQALVAEGVPQERIYLDYAGFRTFDSVVRAEKIFGQRQFTIISQEFHNRRAAYIATSKGLRVVGYNARDVDTSFGWKTQVREAMARVAVFTDLLFGVSPKFLGPKVVIPNQRGPFPFS